MAREQQVALVPTGAAVSNRVLYLTGENGRVAGTGTDYIYALKTSTGKLLRRYRAGGSFNDSPFVANGTVYVASTDGNVYAVSAATGRLRWKFRGDSSIVGAPVVTAGVIIVFGYRSDVYGIKASSGAEVWRADLVLRTGHVGSDVAADPPRVADGTVFVPTDSGFVIAMNPVSGHARWIYSWTGAA